MKDPDMTDHIHLVQFGTGDRRISSGEYQGQPALFVEPVPPAEIGVRSGEDGRFELKDGSVVFRFARPESVAVFAWVAAQLARQVQAEPALRRLSEGEHFCLEAAVHYGFQRLGDEGYQATEQQVIDLVVAAREQGRRDAGAEPKEWPNAAR